MKPNQETKPSLSPSPSFVKYLKAIGPNKAVNHLVDCLINGEANNDAWVLMARAHGPDWQCSPKDLPQKIVDALVYIETLDLKEDET